MAYNQTSPSQDYNLTTPSSPDGTLVITQTTLHDDTPGTGQDHDYLLPRLPLGEHPNMSALGLVVLVVVTVAGNVMVCLAVKLDKRLHHMTCYFFVSLSLVQFLMAAVVMPPATMLALTGQFGYSEEVCKLWTTIDLFFCNNTCLHLAFANMDSFLRLKDPLRHGRIITTCSLVLWLGAPWIIAFVQAIAQFMLSQADHGIIQRSICFIADKNFVILGTLFSFAIPSLIGIIFYVLCVQEIRALKNGKFLDESDASVQHFSRCNSNESIPDDASETGSVASETLDVMPQEQVRLAVVADLRDSGVNECLSNQHLHRVPAEEEDTCFSDEPKPESGHANMAFTDLLTASDQSGSCTLLLRDTNTNHHPNVSIRPNAEDDHDSPDQALRQEIAMSRLMFLLLTGCVSLWLPFSVSNVVYGVCAHCRQNMTFDEMLTFKWLAYSSAMIGPLIYAKSVEHFREAYWNILTCRYCKYH